MGNRPTAREDALTLAPAILAALQTRAELKADGASADGDQVLEDAVRKHWPHEREWKYLCDACSDTGWMLARCTPKLRCGRTWCARSEKAEHTYVSPCQCPKGRSIQVKPPSSDPGDAAAKPRRPWKKLLP